LADKIGKYKVSKREFDEYNAKLDVALTGSHGTFVFPTDLSFKVENGEISTTILGTTGIGSELGIYNNLVYIDGTNLGIGTVEPSGKLEVVGTVVLSDLPTTQPSITGSLWLSGSDAVGKSKNLVVFTG